MLVQGTPKLAINAHSADGDWASFILNSEGQQRLDGLDDGAPMR